MNVKQWMEVWSKSLSVHVQSLTNGKWLPAHYWLMYIHDWAQINVSAFNIFISNKIHTVHVLCSHILEDTHSYALITGTGHTWFSKAPLINYWGVDKNCWIPWKNRRERIFCSDISTSAPTHITAWKLSPDGDIPSVYIEIYASRKVIF